jgi:hypothetical protein
MSCRAGSYIQRGLAGSLEGCAACAGCAVPEARKHPRLMDLRRGKSRARERAKGTIVPPL